MDRAVRGDGQVEDGAGWSGDGNLLTGFGVGQQQPAAPGLVVLDEDPPVVAVPVGSDLRLE
ncbi:hypothetical protein [Micromonospora sp. LOL_015]|uniref:hypothetical protein n=1 Tax=Micromonospora sp. LOL_015 TaxID=3345416 RepID=UPI003A89BA5D